MVDSKRLGLYTPLPRPRPARVSSVGRQPSRTPSLPIEVLTIPFVRFAKLEASSGLLL
jgi:hypothetical protein